MCLHPFLVSVLFSGPCLLALHFYRKFFTPSTHQQTFCNFVALASTIRKTTEPPRHTILCHAVIMKPLILNAFGQNTNRVQAVLTHCYKRGVTSKTSALTKHTQYQLLLIPVSFQALPKPQVVSKETKYQYTFKRTYTELKEKKNNLHALHQDN